MISSRTINDPEAVATPEAAAAALDLALPVVSPIAALIESHPIPWARWFRVSLFHRPICCCSFWFVIQIRYDFLMKCFLYFVDGFRCDVFRRRRRHGSMICLQIRRRPIRRKPVGLRPLKQERSFIFLTWIMASRMRISR